MYTQHICSTSLEPDEESLGDQRVFDVLCDEVVDTWLSDDERHDLFDSQLPTMVDYALQLKTLKPLRGLHFSLQQQSKCVCLSFFLFLFNFLKNHFPFVIYKRIELLYYVNVVGRCRLLHNSLNLKQKKNQFSGDWADLDRTRSIII